MENYLRWRSSWRCAPSAFFCFTGRNCRGLDEASLARNRQRLDAPQNSGGVAMARLLLLRQCSIRRNFLSVCVHVVDIESRIRTDKRRTGRSARELMHVFARHHRVAARAEARATAAPLFHL